MAQAVTSHYDVLGVRPDAPAEDVRRAYVALARRHHPDAHVAAGPAARAEAERRMQELNAAWTVLSDPARRADYDRHRRTGQAEPEWSPPPFRPFDDGDDDPDPLAQPDRPYRPAPATTPKRRAVTLLPVLLFAGSVGALAVAAVVGSAPLLALAVALLVASCVGFVVLPLLALGAARRDEG